MPRVLHVLAQRPSLTGSGVTLEALVREAARAGWEQRVVVGLPARAPRPAVGGLAGEQLAPLTFGAGGTLPFAIPGMSDEMPYASTRFAAMDGDALAAYRRAWREHLAAVLRDFQPDVIHSHHVWLVSALLKDLAPHTRVVTHCHATGLRQMQLCPHLAEEVRRGCARNDHFVALHAGHAAELTAALGIEATRITVVGAGYRSDVFGLAGRAPCTPPRVVYAGKLGAAKGVPQLLDAAEAAWADGADFTLHVAGAGSGAEAADLRRRLRALHPRATYWGLLGQDLLAALLRTAAAFVLPSFYEGVPLVLVEAAACGCRPIATALPGVQAELAPRLGPLLATVPPPRLARVDQPDPADLPAFVEALAAAIRAALAAPDLGGDPAAVEAAVRGLAWSDVFARVEPLWRGGSASR